MDFAVQDISLDWHPLGTATSQPMKILVLTKRQYMGKDLIDDRFGRFRELPLELARLGHDVRGLALSYRRRAKEAFLDEIGPPGKGVAWDSVSVFGRCLPRLQKVTRRAMASALEFRPDLIWSCSDAYHAIFGWWLSRRVRTRCVIDLYDNFEAFPLSRIPGVLPLFRRAVKKSDGITAFSDRMADYVARTYRRSKPMQVIPNGTRKDLFQPDDQKTCRERLGLPAQAKIIGTAGALDSSRGIETLFEAFEMLSRELSDLHLALAGPRPSGLRIPTGVRIHDFKELPHKDVASLINALDLAVVCYRHSAQGEVSLPQKAHEIIACRIPLVAAAVGSMNELLLNHPDCLYEPENSTHLADAIRRQLLRKTIIDIPVLSWTDSAKELDHFLKGLVADEPVSALQTANARIGS
jgi:teichuronic acid biosynthesis glycosyltransferase TuaC